MPSAGRYDIHEQIGAGGMATVHLARLRGSAGFSRAVAVKRLHPSYATDPAFAAMLLDEARLASRIRHPNVVPVVDVVSEGSELVVVMEYVHGESLSSLVRAAGTRLPPELAASIVIGALHGLHAAHVATDVHGQPLGIVHRDVSPQNVLVGVDGHARVLDFGVAKAAARLQTTAEGQVKGKLGYMSIEQIEGGDVDARADVFAAGAVLWELLTGERLFTGRQPSEILMRVLVGHVDRPSARGADTADFDGIVLRALAQNPRDRFPTALAMAEALEATGRVATPRAVGEWVERIAGAALQARADVVARIERGEDAPASRDGVAESISRPINEAVTQSTVLSAVSARAVEPEPAPTRKRRLGTIVALSGAAAGAAGLIVWALVHGAPPANASVEPPSAPAAPPPPATSAAPIALPPATAEAPPVPTAVATDSAPPRRAHPPPVRAPARRESCDPPYFVNANGIHVPKPQCLD